MAIRTTPRLSRCPLAAAVLLGVLVVASCQQRTTTTEIGLTRSTGGQVRVVIFACDDSDFLLDGFFSKITATEWTPEPDYDSPSTTIEAAEPRVLWSIRSTRPRRLTGFTVGKTSPNFVEVVPLAEPLPRLFELDIDQRHVTVDVEQLGGPDDIEHDGYHYSPAAFQKDMDARNCDHPFDPFKPFRAFVVPAVLLAAGSLTVWSGMAIRRLRASAPGGYPRA